MEGLISIKIENLPEIKKAFKEAPAKTTANIDRAIERIILKVEGDAKKEAPVNKQSGGGNLRQSIRAAMTGTARGMVEVGADYGLYVHEGTRAHTIAVVNKKVLANVRTGQFFGRIVKHPGTKANPFLQRVVDSNQNFINSEFENAISNIF